MAANELTGKEVAQLLKVDPGFVRRLRIDGRLPGLRQVGITWLYKRKAIEKFLRTWDRKPGIYMRKQARSNGSAQVRMTDEELTAYIGKAVAKDAATTQHALYKALRASGKSVSGGRVREMFKATHTTAAPKKARQAAATK